jgi:hypothetical protein
MASQPHRATEVLDVSRDKITFRSDSFPTWRCRADVTISQAKLFPNSTESIQQEANYAVIFSYELQPALYVPNITLFWECSAKLPRALQPHCDTASDWLCLFSTDRTASHAYNRIY